MLIFKLKSNNLQNGRVEVACINLIKNTFPIRYAGFRDEDILVADNSEGLKLFKLNFKAPPNKKLNLPGVKKNNMSLICTERSQLSDLNVPSTR